jgi:pantetheine-phosphate adenylyltransferase
MENKKIGVYPGTFDPITLGHLDIIARAAKVFSHLTVAVAESTKKNTAFSLDERVEMVMDEIKRNGLGNVSVKPFNGLLVEFLKEEKASVIVRGLRALGDFEYEFKMAYMNHKLDSSVETIFLPATDSCNFISSSFAHETARLGGSLEGLVSKYVAEKMRKFYQEKE